MGRQGNPHRKIKEKPHLISFHGSSGGQKILPWTYCVYRWRGTRFIWASFVLSLCGFFLSTAKCILEVPASLSLVFLFCSRARVYHHSLLDSVNAAVTSCLQTIVTFTRVLGVKATWGLVAWNGWKSFLRSQGKMMTLFIEKYCFRFHVRPSNKRGE